MKTTTLADLRAHLSAYLDQVAGSHERVTITRNGIPEAVLLSIQDLEALEETLDVLGDSGALGEIERARADLHEGRGVGLDEVRADRAHAGPPTPLSAMPAVERGARPLGDDADLVVFIVAEEGVLAAQWVEGGPTPGATDFIKRLHGAFAHEGLLGRSSRLAWLGSAKQAFESDDDARSS